MLLNKQEKDQVMGEIYKITNITNGKVYIGQTRSHRLNHDKYRPFGYLGRFKDHIHEANSNKKHQSRYLNYALKKYGEENFTCEKLHTCSLNELDDEEKHFIDLYKSKYPNGYNLTDGGKGFTDIEGNYLWKQNNEQRTVKLPSQPRSEYTKKLISTRLKSFYNDDAKCRERGIKTQSQHLAKKYQLFKDVTIDESKIDSYIRVIQNHTNNTEYVRVVINKKRITFVSKHEPIEEIKNRARHFILDLKEWQHTLMRETP